MKVMDPLGWGREVSSGPCWDDSEQARIADTVASRARQDLGKAGKGIILFAISPTSCGLRFAGRGIYPANSREVSGARPFCLTE